VAALKALVDEGKIKRVGTGRRGDPFVYVHAIYGPAADDDSSPGGDTESF
jgi:hypothetical protein